MGFALEERLLIQCSRTNMSEETITSASNLLRQRLNWDYILETSIRHGVSPLLYHGLNQVSEIVELDNLVPARIMEALQKLYRGNRSRNRRLYRVIADMSKAFQQVGIQALGLKDVQLAREVYPDIGLRPIADIDILIHPEDYSKAATCMGDLGFIPLPSSNIPYTLKYAWGQHFRRLTDEVWIDLQWNVIQREWDTYQEGNFDFEIDRMWRGARPMTIEDCQILVPKPEDMLFHLCLHLEGHAYAELILFCDIAELLRYYADRLDWKYFASIAKKYGAESSVYYVLLFVHHLFEASLPARLLGELEPACFEGNILNPLFGNLTPLHLSLDEIRLAASPPDELMSKFEAVVRRQAVGAMQLYKEIDDITHSFISSGGALVILDGTSSERMFPDPSLRAFEEICLFVLDDDLPRMRQTLTECGFELRSAHNPETYAKIWEFASVDPVLAEQPTLMTLEVDIERELDHMFSAQDRRSASRRDMALRLLKAKLGGRENDSARIPVQIKIMCLSPEDMLLCLSSRLGKKERHRLFGLCSVLEFFRGYSGPLDWQQIASAAQQYGVSRWACEGLLMARGLLDNGSLPLTALRLLFCSESLPRVLEWARYGTSSLARYAGLKRAFLYLFSFLSVDGVNAKCRYLLRSFWGDHGNKPVLAGLTLELMRNVFSLLRSKNEDTLREFAYWIEPESAFETESVNDWQV